MDRYLTDGGGMGTATVGNRTRIVMVVDDALADVEISTRNGS